MEVFSLLVATTSPIFNLSYKVIIGESISVFVGSERFECVEPLGQLSFLSGHCG